MPGFLFWLLLPAHIAVNLAALIIAVARGKGGPAWQGLMAAVTGIRPIWKSRREIQSRRRVSTWDIAKILIWSPFAMFKRAAQVLPARPWI